MLNMASPPLPLRLLITAPLLVSGLHALSTPEEHEGKVRNFARVVAEPLPKNRWTTALKTITPKVGEMIATASGAAVTAASLTFIAGRDTRLSAAVLALTVPTLAAANYPLRKSPLSDPQISLDEVAERPAIAGWLGLAPLFAALTLSAMASPQDTRTK